jgi:hypothetical protein
MVADEIQRQVAPDNSEAPADAQNQDMDPGVQRIARMLSYNQPRAFAAGSDLDLVEATGQ